MRRRLVILVAAVTAAMSGHAPVGATLGLKLEYNDYTGVEVLPSARLTWRYSEGQLLWAAVSRAVRAPALPAWSELDVRLAWLATPRLELLGAVRWQF